MFLTHQRPIAHAVRNFACRSALIAAAIAVSALNSQAGLFTLSDANSVAEFDTGAQANNFNWRVDGQDQLFTQGFWYRVGNAAEQSITSLPIIGEIATNTNFDPGLDTLFVAYGGTGFDISVRYVLHGGLPGSRSSDMAEQIRIDNRGPGPLDFHFFQYVDFDLNGTAGGDSGVFTNINTVRQSEGALRVAKTVLTPPAHHREISPFPVILTKLNDGVATTLNDLPPIGTVVGPGDITWAFQWDVVIPRGGSFIISKDKLLGGVPEPTTLVLASFAATLIVGLRRKR